MMFTVLPPDAMESFLLTVVRPGEMRHELYGSDWVSAAIHQHLNIVSFHTTCFAAQCMDNTAKVLLILLLTLGKKQC